MECNKDEAERARGIAERKFLAQDWAGAEKFICKARQLYPGLEGLNQLTAVLEVHAVANQKGKDPADTNWYGILKADPSTDESIIRKHYRKLALLLHPDKNKCVGAEAAFKLISEAWRILSDKSSRASYDLRRNSNTNNNTHSASNNGFSSTSSYRSRPPAPPPAPAPAPAPAPPRPTKTIAFWTACPFCKMYYEFLRVYENRNLCCPICVKVFAAREVPVNLQENSSYCRNADMPPPSSQRRKEPKETMDPSKRKEALFHAKEAFVQRMESLSKECPPNVAKYEPKLASNAARRGAPQEEEDADKKVPLRRSCTTTAHASDENHCHPPVKKTRVDGIETEKAMDDLKCNRPSADLHVKMDNSSMHRFGELVKENEGDPSTMPFVSIVEDAIAVPESEIYDFEQDRAENLFAVGQIWALYDEADGMPRYYARIDKAISISPFKMHISWLEPCVVTDELLAHMAAGFHCTCGNFKLANSSVTDYINTFSHSMKFETRPNGDIQIYPRKGEVWAIYKHWNGSLQAEEEKDYDMVEVMSSYEDGLARVAFLAKMEGHRSLFCRVEGEGSVFSILSSEMLRFSHQVPAHWLASVVDGCWELDPASIPMKLISGRPPEEANQGMIE